MAMVELLFLYCFIRAKRQNGFFFVDALIFAFNQRCSIQFLFSYLYVSFRKHARRTNSENEMKKKLRKKDWMKKARILDTFLGVTENDNFHLFCCCCCFFLSGLWFAWKTLGEEKNIKANNEAKRKQNDCRRECNTEPKTEWTRKKN